MTKQEKIKQIKELIWMNIQLGNKYKVDRLKYLLKQAKKNYE